MKNIAKSTAILVTLLTPLACTEAAIPTAKIALPENVNFLTGISVNERGIFLLSSGLPKKNQVTPFTVFRATNMPKSIEPNTIQTS